MTAMWNRPADPASIEAVALGMKDRDFEEFRCTSWHDTRKALSDSLVQRYAWQDGAYVFGTMEEPIAVAGFFLLRPNVVTLGFWSTPSLPKILLPLTRFVTRDLWPAMRKEGLHRIECDTLDTYPEMHRWLETLGLRREGTMPLYGKNGETFARFAWTRNDASPVRP